MLSSAYTIINVVGENAAAVGENAVAVGETVIGDDEEVYSCGATNFGGTDVCCSNSKRNELVKVGKGLCSSIKGSDCDKYYAHNDDNGKPADPGFCYGCYPDLDGTNCLSYSEQSSCIQCNICHGTCCTDETCSNQPSGYDDECKGVTKQDACNEHVNCTYDVPCYYRPDDTSGSSCDNVIAAAACPEYSCVDAAGWPSGPGVCNGPDECQGINDETTCNGTNVEGDCVQNGSPCYSKYGVGQCKDPPQTDSCGSCVGYYGECSAGSCYSDSGVGQCKEPPQTESSTKCLDRDGCKWMSGTCSTNGDPCSKNSDCPACTWSPGTCKSTSATCTKDDDCQPCTWKKIDCSAYSVKGCDPEYCIVEQVL